MAMQANTLQFESATDFMPALRGKSPLTASSFKSRVVRAHNLGKGLHTLEEP